MTGVSAAGLAWYVAGFFEQASDGSLLVPIAWFAGCCAGIFLFFVAAVKNNKTPEARARGAISAWLALLVFFLAVFSRDAERNLWLLDVANKTMLGARGAHPDGMFVSAFAWMHLVVARHFILLAAASSVAVGWVYHAVVAAFFGYEKVARLTVLRPPRWLPLVFAALFGWRRTGWAAPFTLHGAIVMSAADVLFAAYTLLGLAFCAGLFFSRRDVASCGGGPDRFGLSDRMGTGVRRPGARRQSSGTA
ncbi:MAG: hypothetical protein M5R36_13055 [Deltaproteobacteria bacterium]|nr:hypothetical protein [Deltaproteobacteria bacterium]